MREVYAAESDANRPAAEGGGWPLPVGLIFSRLSAWLLSRRKKEAVAA